jgi:hypothetical protein
MIVMREMLNAAHTEAYPGDLGDLRPELNKWKLTLYPIAEFVAFGTASNPRLACSPTQTPHPKIV